MSATLTAEQAETRNAWRAYLADEAIASHARSAVDGATVKSYRYAADALYPRACSRCKVPKACASFNIARGARRRANCAQCSRILATT